MPDHPRTSSHPASHPLPRRAALSTLLALASATVLTMPAHAQGDPQQRILVFGDSQAQGLAGGVQRYYRGDKEHRVLDRSKISTGLVPRSNYDWPVQARGIASAEHADIAFALFGANDRPPVRIGGRMDPGLVQRFSDTYGARVAEIAGCFKQNRVPLVWVGHPIVRDAAFNEDMALLNDIFSTRVAEAGAPFLSTWDAFKGPDGAFAIYGRGVDGQTTRLRADDGVHMTPAGYDMITAMLLPFIEKLRRQPPLLPTAARLPIQG